MSKKGSMPPELLAHFKKKQEEKEGSPEEQKKATKSVVKKPLRKPALDWKNRSGVVSMTKKTKLVKKALKKPELYTQAELQYFRLWLASKKKEKELKKLSSLN